MKKLTSIIAAGAIFSATVLTNLPSANALNMYIYPTSSTHDGIVSVSSPNGKPELFGANQNQLRYTYTFNKDMTTSCSINVDPQFGGNVAIHLICQESSGIADLTAEINPISWHDIVHGPDQLTPILNTPGSLIWHYELDWTYNGAVIEVKKNNADHDELHLELFW
jgi:hypothetical protein